MRLRFLGSLLAAALLPALISAQNDLSVVIANPDTVNLCLGQSVLLTQTNDAADPRVDWSPAGPSVTPTLSGYYVVRVMDTDGRVGSDSVYLDVDRLAVPDLISDTTICQSYPLGLLNSELTGTENTNYRISPGFLFTDSTDINSIIRPQADTVLTVISEVANGACVDTQTVRITITPSNVQILAGVDTIFRCSDVLDTLVLSAAAFPGTGSVIQWRPETFATSPAEGPVYQILPTSSITYYASSVVNGCFQEDSVRVQIDSLPDDMSQTLEPEKDPYCQGDTIAVTSPIYDVADYPLIQHNWFEARGIASPEELYNAIIFADTTGFLKRETTSGGCIRTDSVFITVAIPPTLVFEPEDPMVCAGEPLQIEGRFESGNGTVEWMDPNMTLSCTDCLNPIATVNQSTEYEITITAEGSECTAPQMYRVEVLPPDIPTEVNNTIICPGDEARLILTSGAGLPDYRFEITGPGLETNLPNVTVSPTETTTYDVLTVSPCDSSVQQVTVTVRQAPDLAITGPTESCPNEQITLTAEVTGGTFPDNELSWLVGPVQIGTGRSVTFNPSDFATTTVNLVYQGDCPGQGASAAYEVNVIGDEITPQIIASTEDGTPISEDRSLASGNRVVLSVGNLPAGLDYTFSWSGNFDPMTSTEPFITVTVPQDGRAALEYDVIVTTTGSGCTFEDEIVFAVEELMVQVPQVITPNGDGVNDGFRLFTNGDLTDYSLVIFNRWGQKVFTSNDPTEAWAGELDGTPQNMDTYYFIAKYVQSGTEQDLDGEFTLVR